VGVRRWFLLALLCWAACVPSEENWPDGRPEILDVNFLDIPSSRSQKLGFVLQFADTDGDLESGSLMITVNENIDSEIRLKDLFAAQMPKLSPTASEGELRFEVSLSGINLVNGEFVDFEFALCDASGQTSNRTSLRLLTVIREAD